MKFKIFLPVCCITFFVPFFTYAQNATPSDRRGLLPEEKEDDPYLPNAYNNQKTSPPADYKIKGSQQLMSSGISTHQVNVNSSGQNILGDAANEPNLVLNPRNSNKIVIGWRQFDNVTSNFRQAGWSYTTNAGATWNFAGKIDAGVFRSDPVLDYDTLGNFYYNSLKSNFNCMVFKSSNGGATWGAGVDAKGGDKQWMAIDRTTGVGSGNVYSFWTSSYTTCQPGFFTRSSTKATSFESCTQPNDSSYWNSMAVGNNGELYVAGSGQVDSVIVEKSTNAQVPSSVIVWDAPVIVYMDGHLNAGTPINPSGLVGQANIDVDHSNGPGKDNVYILASITRATNTDPADIMFVRSTDGGKNWSAPKRVNDDASTTNTQWMGTMSVAPNGRIDAVWLDTRDAKAGSDSSALYYSYSTDQGTTWTVNEKMSALFDPHVGYPNQSKMGDYFDMQSDNSGAHLTWTNTLNGEEDVYYSHITPNNPTGVNEISSSITSSISPNPTSGIFNISCDAKEYLTEVYNMMGEKVYSKENFKIKNEIDISSQPNGVYLVNIRSGEGFCTRKVVIQK